MAGRHEKIFNITNYWRNANQNTMRYYLIPVKMAITEDKKQQMLKRMWRKRDSCTRVVGI